MLYLGSGNRGARGGDHEGPIADHIPPDHVENQPGLGPDSSLATICSSTPLIDPGAVRFGPPETRGPGDDE